jgi:hypothetical protein
MATAKGKVNAAKLVAGTRILVTTDKAKGIGSYFGEDGQLFLSRVKRGVQVATVVRLDAKLVPGFRRASRVYTIVTDLGEIGDVAPVQNMWLAPEAPAVANVEEATDERAAADQWNAWRDRDGLITSVTARIVADEAEAHEINADRDAEAYAEEVFAKAEAVAEAAKRTHANLVATLPTRTGSTRFATREEWLTAAVEMSAQLFAEIGRTIPAVRVSVGWPGGRGKKNAVIGQCWASHVTADKTAQIFISPVLDDAAKVLATLVHELVHAVDDCKSGHQGDFAKMARRVGLAGKLTATTAGDELAAKLADMSVLLGAYPHGRIAAGADGADGPKKQTTRMVKCGCDECGYIARTTRQHLDAWGAPICPCNREQMRIA